MTEDHDDDGAVYINYRLDDSLFNPRMATKKNKKNLSICSVTPSSLMTLSSMPTAKEPYCA